MVLAHAEAVHVGGPRDRDLGDLLPAAVIANAADTIEAPAAKIGVVVMARALRVVMRMRGRDLAGERFAIGEDTERLQRVGREVHRHERLGEGDGLCRVA